MSQPPAPAPLAERRLVSVLFADLVGFTPFAEERDAEDVRETLTRYFDLARGIIEPYGGTVEKFIGDAVMAVWGAPIAREDDAERAVRAALDLVDGVPALGPAIRARAAVLTGEAAVTIGATNQGMVAGDLVNTAARLQAAAEPGTVLVGEATYEAASAAIVFEAIGGQTLKGKAAPVPAWHALRVVAERGGRNRSDTLEAPFVGRDDELRLLKDQFRSTSRESRLRLVSVIGPAGIGKSRLAWEFNKYVDGLVEEVWWHQGRSPAYGAGVTFWALGEMVRRRAGLLETDDESTTRARIAAIVTEHIPDPAERRWIEPALLTLLGLGGSIASEQLFAAWRAFFERLAGTGPVAMVFEDLHWADPGTLDFIDSMLDWSRGAPIFIVTLARPELLEQRPDWGAARRNFLSISLEPLPEAAMRELLAGLVPGLPDRAVRRIVARADGIPLYAVETVRKLVAEGRLLREGDRYVPVGDLATIAVPETLRALIAARLDALEPPERALIQDAAVLGQSFTPAALSAVSGLDLGAMEPRLRTLVKRELLALENDPRSPEQGQYAFVQALIREVAYATLSRHDRKARHLSAARYFESLGTDELAGALAGHYLAAHANAPAGPEAEALAVQARIALVAAADRAAALGSHEQAAAFATQALEVSRDDAERAQLRERAGIAFAALGRYDDAEVALRDAIAMHRRNGDRSGTVRAIALLGKALLQTLRVEAAMELLAPAADEFADFASDPGVVELRSQLARGHYLSEDARGALPLLESVLEAAEALDLVPIIADALVTRGSALGVLGRSHESLALLAAGRDLAAANGQVDIRLRAVNNLSTMIFTGSPREALAMLRDGLADARRLGMRGWVAGLGGNAVECALYAGEWDWATAEAEAILAIEPDAEDRLQILQALIAVRAFRGQPLDRELTDAERLWSAMPTWFGTAMRHNIGAYVAFAAGDFALARRKAGEWIGIDSLNAPIATATATRAALWEGDAAGVATGVSALAAMGSRGDGTDLRRRTLAAGLAAVEGRTREALREYLDVLAQWEACGAPWERALATVDMATVLDTDDPSVAEAVARGREILVGLGAAPFIERLDAAVGRLPARPRVTVSPATSAGEALVAGRDGSSTPAR